MKRREIKQGDIYICNLDDNSVESEQCGIRPVLVLSVDILNKNRKNVIVAPITSSLSKKNMINHYQLSSEAYTELVCKNNIVLLECLRDVSKTRLDKRVCRLKENDLSGVLDLVTYDFREFDFNLK